MWVCGAITVMGGFENAKNERSASVGRVVFGSDIDRRANGRAD
jgi:hypothetical protein